MNTTTLHAPSLAAITSTVGALSDRELLRQISTLVRHERHLLGAVIDHLAEIDARRLYLQRGCSSLFDYAVRELGYSDAAAARRIGAVRLCADQPGARERLRDGSLTLSAAAELQWAFDRQRRSGSICGTASRAPAGSAPENAAAAASAGRTAGFGAVRVSGAGRSGGRYHAAPDLSSSRFAAAGARCGGKAETGGGRGRQERAPSPPDAGRPGPGAGDAGRPDAPARRRPLRVEGAHRRRMPPGAGAAPRAALARGPAHDAGATRRAHRASRGGRRRQEALERHDPSRQPRRARTGSRPAERDAKPASASKHQAAPEPKPGHALTVSGAATPAGTTPTPERARQPTPASARSPSRQEATDRRAATGREPARAATVTAKPRASGRAIPAAVKRQVWQRDGGRCRYVDRQTGRRCNSRHMIEIDHILPYALGGGADPENLRLLCGAHHRHRHAPHVSTRIPEG